jgi:hypothetical protein
MIRTYSSFERQAFRFLVVFALLVVAAGAYPHGTGPQQSARLQGCRGPDVNTNSELVNGPGDLFTAAFVMRNISQSPCLLDRLAYGVNGSPTYPDRTEPNGKVFVVSPDSENHVWGIHPPFDVPPILAPGKVAYMTIQWKTRPQKESDPCIQPAAINWPVLVVAPTLFGRLCSDISVSPFTVGEFHGPGKSKRQPWQARRNEKLNLSAYGEGETFFFRVLPTHPDRAQQSPEHVFPALYLRERSFRSQYPTSAKEHRPNGISPGPAVSGYKPPDCNYGCDFDLSDDCYETVGEHTFQAFQVIDVLHDGPIRFIHSNVLRVRWNASSLPQCRVGTGSGSN